ncbi:MAG: cheR2 [Firmicutes bacterium]|nr:cheR2 [Bacillota bacterium]
MTELQEWELFKQKLFAKSSINLNDYKPAQMQRRITNFSHRNHAEGYLDFFQKIDKDAKLYKTFIDYLTINVTEFFRTPEKFNELESVVLPHLLTKRQRLNIWSAGCSIGAEPYSLAMALDHLTPSVRHRILGTDLDVEMLNKAKQGLYTANELKNVTVERLKRYFSVQNESYLVQETIRSRVELNRHNLLLDAFEDGFDLILCRNVVIYFTEEAKNALYRRFFKALRPGGVLFVGGTEAILNFREMGFESYLPFFYRKPVTG